jgi:hypothetical protein
MLIETPWGTLAARQNRILGRQPEIEKNCYAALRKSALPCTLRQQQAAGSYRYVLQSSL